MTTKDLLFELIEKTTKNDENCNWCEDVKNDLIRTKNEVFKHLNVYTYKIKENKSITLVVQHEKHKSLVDFKEKIHINYFLYYNIDNDNILIDTTTIEEDFSSIKMCNFQFTNINSISNSDLIHMSIQTLFNFLHKSIIENILINKNKYACKDTIILDIINDLNSNGI